MESLKEKQIEEMAKHCPCYFGGECCFDGELPEKCDRFCQYGTYAEILYNAGYRKQREGEWIVTNSDGVWHYDCPFCDDGYAQKEKLPAANYCENCGARLYDPKMKGATDER